MVAVTTGVDIAFLLISYFKFFKVMERRQFVYGGNPDNVKTYFLSHHCSLMEHFSHPLAYFSPILHRLYSLSKMVTLLILICCPVDFICAKTAESFPLWLDQLYCLGQFCSGWDVSQIYTS